LRSRPSGAGLSAERDGQFAVPAAQLFQAESDGAETQAVSHLDPAALQTLSVDVGAVLAPQILQTEPAGLDHEKGMPPRDAGQGEDDVAVEPAADAVEAGSQEIGPPVAADVAAEGERMPEVAAQAGHGVPLWAASQASTSRRSERARSPRSTNTASACCASRRAARRSPPAASRARARMKWLSASCAGSRVCPDRRRTARSSNGTASAGRFRSSNVSPRPVKGKAGSLPCQSSRS